MQPNLLSGFPFNKRRAFFYCFTFFLLGGIAVISGLAYDLEQNFDWSLGLKTREVLGKSPHLSDDLVIVGLDDISVASQQLTELNLKSWSVVLNGIAATQPHVILIDKIFNSPLRPQQPELFIKGTERLPIVVGAMVANVEIEGRPLLSLERPEFFPKSYYDPTRPPAALKKSLLQAETLPRFPYGPNPDFIAGFSRLGHIQLDERNTIKAFEVASPDRLIPHFSFLAAKSVSFNQDGALLINDKYVSLDEDARIAINIVTPNLIRTKIVRMDKLIDAIANGKQLPEFKPGSTVLVLPNLYTGGGDIKQTPLGKIPGGYIQASLINSVLTGQWLQKSPDWAVWFFLVASACFFFFCAIRLSPLQIGLLAAVSTTATILFGLYLFSYQSYLSPGIFLGVWSGGMGFTLAFEKARTLASRIDMLTNSLGGKISVKEINEIVRNHQFIDRNPSVQTLTVMFIDLVGFSKLAENIPAPELFVQLKMKLNEIRETIYQYGGYVDRTLGDGMLCYFGFRYSNSEPNINHAEQALLCAKTLQLQNLSTNLVEIKAGRVIYPMRIGINTTSACVGDLGDDMRVDFTAIGNGVNFTKRLETACGFYRVMFSESTRELLSNNFLSEATGRLNKRLVQIKHHSDLKPAFEFDPVPSSADDAVTVLRYFWSTLGLQRSDERLSVPGSAVISASGTYVNGTVSNFSINGLALTLDQYIADGAEIVFALDTMNGKLGERLRMKDLYPIKAEVRWGIPVGDNFLHGVVFRGLTPSTTKYLFDALSDCLKQSSSPRESL